MEFCPRCGAVLIQKRKKDGCPRCSYSAKGRVKIKTSEKIDGVPFPKDLVLVPIDMLPNYSAIKNRSRIKNLEDASKNKIYTKTHNFPKVSDQIIGRFKFNGKE